MQQKGFRKKYIWLYSLKIDKNTQILLKMGSTYHSLYLSNNINLAKKYTTVIKWSVHYNNYLPRFHANKNVEQRKRNKYFKIDSGYFLVFVQLYDLYNRYLFCLHKHIWNKRIEKNSRQMAITDFHTQSLHEYQSTLITLKARHTHTIVRIPANYWWHVVYSLTFSFLPLKLRQTVYRVYRLV